MPLPVGMIYPQRCAAAGHQTDPGADHPVPAADHDDVDSFLHRSMGLVELSRLIAGVGNDEIQVHTLVLVLVLLDASLRMAQGPGLARGRIQQQQDPAAAPASRATG